MIRLFYVSTATDAFDPSTLSVLADSAGVKNARLGITGALAFNGSIFAQVLEGTESNVDSLMESIEADPRHKAMIIISRRPIARRSFEDWSMKHIQALNFEELVDSLVA